jgi:protein phosphatase
VKLLRKLKGVNVQITHGIDRTLEQLNGYPDAFIQRVKNFIDGLVSHYVFDDGKLVTAHAGMKAEYQGRGSAKVRDFALYGETTGEIDEYGLPVRYDWATDYRGKALVVYGHTPLAEPAVLNNTINIDTGCVFGGKLTAYRYPEGEFVSVPAFAAYYKSAKPLFTEIAPAAVSDSRADDDTPDIGDVLGKKIVDTHLMKNVIIREENAMAALEVMSRFSADPRWIIYLPPTMSPCETSKDDAFLEHPEEAFSYYGQRDVEKVVCEQKHMGSRAVVIVCRTPEAALRRFGVSDDSLGICYTRTGRRFFDNAEMEAEFIDSIRQSLERSKLFDDFETDWVCLDCELMPWSAKAQELLKRQYAPVGVAGSRGLSAAVEALESAIAHGSKPFDVSQLASGHNANLSELLERFTQRRDSIEKYIESYRGYCWSVHSLADLRLAPFHILATERVVHVDKNHLWHMDSIKKYCADTSDIMIATNHIEVELARRASRPESTGGQS